ncbi:unnamed protein product [Chrysoparadoxa australica]
MRSICRVHWNFRREHKHGNNSTFCRRQSLYILNSAVYILIAQLVVPLFLVIWVTDYGASHNLCSQVSNSLCELNDMGEFPFNSLERCRTDILLQKVLMGCFAALYLARFYGVSRKKLRPYPYETIVTKEMGAWFTGHVEDLTGFADERDRPDLKTWYCRTTVGKWGGIDDLMDVMYEGIVYLLNFWIIADAESLLDMVLNSLALEFVMELDDKFRAEYLERYRANLFKYLLESSLLEPADQQARACKPNDHYRNWYIRVLIAIMDHIGNWISKLFALVHGLFYAPEGHENKLQSGWGKVTKGCATFLECLLIRIEGATGARLDYVDGEEAQLPYKIFCVLVRVFFFCAIFAGPYCK